MRQADFIYTVALNNMSFLHHSLLMVIEVVPSPLSLEVKNPLSPARGLTLALQVKLVVSKVLRGSKERVLVNGS